MDSVNIYSASQSEMYEGLPDNLGVKDYSHNNLSIPTDQQAISASYFFISSLLFKKKLVHRHVENSVKRNSQLNDELHPHTERTLSHIEDPLWEKICFEVGRMMGDFAIQKIWDSKLGSFCSKDNTIDLCCPTEEAAQFINQYSFLVLGSLQRYFPSIRALKTKVRYVN